MSSEDTIIKSSKVEFVDNGIFSSDYAEYLEQLQKENDELKAHVELLREVVSLFVETYMPGRESGVNSISMPDEIVAGCLVLSKTPAQSLNHIRAQVEEETIERCISKLKLHNPPNGALSDLATMLRKYKEQSDEFSEERKRAQLHYDHSSRSITHCQADCDGDCEWEHCPQLRDNEPESTGRHCPLDDGEEPI